MKYKIVMAVSIIFSLSNLLSCNNLTLYDIYKNENLPAEIKGKVEYVELYKGGGITLIVSEDSGGKKQIALAREFREYVRKGDHIEKEKNTNKCIIKRNDSIIYLDCFKEIPQEVRDSLGEIEEWPRDIEGQWQIR